MKSTEYIDMANLTKLRCIEALLLDMDSSDMLSAKEINSILRTVREKTNIHHEKIGPLPVRYRD